MEYKFDRFIKAQKNNYEIALREIKNGKKTTHWMWYIFPQVKGLGHSATAEYYGLEGIEEAYQYMQNSTLKKHMQEICMELINLKEGQVEDIFGYPDYLKLQSSMTVFALAYPDEQMFKDILNKYFDGKQDENTIQLCKINNNEDDDLFRY